MSVVTGAAAARPTASAYSIFFSQGADAPWKKKSSGRESVSTIYITVLEKITLSFFTFRLWELKHTLFLKKRIHPQFGESKSVMTSGASDTNFCENRQWPPVEYTILRLVYNNRAKAVGYTRRSFFSIHNFFLHNWTLPAHIVDSINIYLSIKSGPNWLHLVCPTGISMSNSSLVF